MIDFSEVKVFHSFRSKHELKMSSVDGARASHVSSDEILETECGPCLYEGIKKNAVIYCYQCEDYLCSSCRASHQKLPTTRKHQVVSSDAVLRKETSKTQFVSQNTAVKCLCNDKFVTLYCQEHKEVICEDCRKLKHRNCRVSSIDDAIKGTEQINKKQISQQIQELGEKVLTSRVKRSNDIDSLEIQTTMCRSCVHDLREKLNKQLDKLEENALNDIETKRIEEMIHIKKDIETCKIANVKLDADYNVLESTPNGEKWLIFIQSLQLAKTMEHVQEVLRDINNDETEPKIFFDSNPTVMKIHTKGLGTVRTLRLKESRPNIADLIVKSSKKIDVKDPADSRDPWISGSVFMPSGELVLCFWNKDNGVKVLNTDFTLKEQIKLQAIPWDVDTMSPVEVVVSSPGSKSLIFVKVYPKLKTGSTVQFDQACRGVAVYNTSIFVSFEDGTVRILDRAGKQMETINSSLESRVPYYIAVPKLGLMYISEHYTNNIRLLNDGKEVYIYKHSLLKRPVGMYIDGGENVFVCGCESDNVHIIDKDGKHKRVLLTASDGLINPYTISFRPSDNTLIVGGIMGLRVFKLG